MLFFGDGGEGGLFLGSFCFWFFGGRRKVVNFGWIMLRRARRGSFLKVRFFFGNLFFWVKRSILERFLFRSLGFFFLLVRRDEKLV